MTKRKQKTNYSHFMLAGVCYVVAVAFLVVVGNETGMTDAQYYAALGFGVLMHMSNASLGYALDRRADKKRWAEWDGS